MTDDVHEARAADLRMHGGSDFAQWLATEDQDGITRLCTMIGALVLARATKGSPLSEEILTTAHTALTANS